jgi:drug/metabolite transporter (DMT)-like permease
LWLDAVIALILFGCIPVVVRSIAANPYAIGIFRLAIATVFLGTILAGRGDLRRVPLRDMLRLAAIGALFALHWLTLFLAIKASTASIASIGQSTYGAFLLLLGAVGSRQRIRFADVVAVGLAAFGAVLVLPSFDSRNAVFVGMSLATLSAALYAMLPLLHQRWSHIPNTTRALGQFAFAWLFFLSLAGKARWDLAPRDWAGLLFLALGATLIAHTLWVRVTTRLAPSTTSILYYGSIPVAVLLGVVVLHEPLTLRMIAGALLIIGGSVFGLSRRS